MSEELFKMDEFFTWVARTDREFLNLLLKQGESQRLDFKQKLDLSDNKAKLEFVKDVISMANRAPGGHLVIGVCDDGTLPPIKLKIDNPKMWDPSALQEITNSYTECGVSITTQIHEIDGHDVVIVAIQSPESALPIPMSKDGVYSIEKYQKYVFRQGDIFVRDGARNSKIRWSHWDFLLKEHDKQIRKEAEAEIETLFNLFFSKINQYAPGKGAELMDLNFETSLDTFHEIVKTHIIRGNPVPLQRFVDVLKNTLLATDNPEKEIDCLNRLTVVACESAASANLGILKYVISILHEFYYKCNNSANLSTLLELLKRVFVIGSAALRFSLFSEVHRLIDHTNQPSGNAYVYNWIRHIQVQCSRAEIITSDPQTLMVGATHALILQNKAFRPDLPEYIINSTQIKDTDPILNSLCQFSFLQAWYVTADNNCQVQGYTDVYIYKQIRTEEIYLKVFREEEVRLALFPEITMPVLVSSFKEVYRRITNQNFTWNSDWMLLFPKDIDQILTSYEI